MAIEGNTSVGTTVADEGLARCSGPGVVLEVAEGVGENFEIRHSRIANSLHLGAPSARPPLGRASFEPGLATLGCVR